MEEGEEEIAQAVAELDDVLEAGVRKCLAQIGGMGELCEEV